MLLSLSIQNYALIEQLEFIPKNGFISITGETGAGKSIIVGALSLILGNRADVSILHNPQMKCVVEGSWQISLGDEISKIFTDNGIDQDLPIITRREMGVNGKSRAFINDCPVSLTVLKELAGFLVDVSSQHETIKLCSSNFQIKALDSFGALTAKSKSFSVLFKAFKNLKDEYQVLVDKQLNSSREKDFIEYQINEISELNYALNEFETLEKDLMFLENAEEIKSSANDACLAIDNNESGILNFLDSILSRLKKASKVHPTISDIVLRIESARIEIKDIHQDLERISDSVEFSPEQIDRLNIRYNQINTIVAKHRLDKANDLLALKEKLQLEFNSFEELSERIELLSKHIASTELQLQELAAELSGLRMTVKQKLQAEVQTKVRQLGMPDALFEINHSQRAAFNENGLDDFEFFFTANKGGKPSSLAAVASGGELSRIMLALKVVAGRENQVSTMVFDEIDTGISGLAASKVAEQLSDLAQFVQVISITHLPQIAGKSSQQFKVYKETRNDKTHTQITELTYDERVNELATMLSGKSDSKVAQQAAIELLA